MKGIVYLIVGALALLAAFGAGGRVTDPTGAIASILDQPLGRPAVACLATGLAFYALWRFLEAFADANRVGRTRRSLAKRAAWAASGVVYALLAVDAARLALYTRTDGAIEVPGMIIASPLAPWLVVLVAVAVIGYGVKELHAALRRRLSERLNLGKLSRESGPIVVEISRVGMIARAVVLMALGVVLLRARSNPRRAVGDTDIGDSLRLVATLGSGPWLLELVAAGLIAYGVYQLVHARYRVITPP